MSSNGNLLGPSANTNDVRKSAGKLNFKTHKSQTQIVCPSKGNVLNATYRTDSNKPELCINSNSVKGHAMFKREIQQKNQNSVGSSKNLDKNVNKTRTATNTHNSHEPNQAVAEVLDQINRLSHSEKVMLYLHLPGAKNLVDPLKQPLNPLGNRFEITQTLTWIRTHLKENQAVSLPKQEVYEEYKSYCSKNTMKPLSTADFGKVMKQIFPDVRARRLGTRGNSRYCYAGLCKMNHLPLPQLPKIINNSETSVHETNCKMKEVVCSWLGKVMGKKFDSFKEIGKHLLSFEKNGKELNLIVPCQAKSVSLLKPKPAVAQDNGRRHSIQETFSITSVESAGTTWQSDVGKGKRMMANIVTRKRPATSLLNENITNKKIRSSAHQSDSNESICDINNRRQVKKDSLHGRSGKVCVSDDLKPDNSTKAVPLISRVKHVLNSDSNDNVNKSSAQCNSVKCTIQSVASETKFKEVLSSVQNHSQKCMSLKIGSKLPIPRLPKQCRNRKPAAGAKVIVLPAGLCPLSPVIRQYKHIQPSPINVNVEKKLNTSTETSANKKYEICFLKKQGIKQDKNDNQVSIDDFKKNALDGYLDSNGNSHEQEEELLQYFHQQSPMISPAPVGQIKSIQATTLLDLKTFLEENVNGIGKCGGKRNTVTLEMINKRRPVSNVTSVNSHQNQKSGVSSLIFADSTLSTRRKVSFEKLPNSVPQSPNTRRKFFNFTPISPTKIKPILENTLVSPCDKQKPYKRVTDPHSSNPVISAQSNLPKNQNSVVYHDSVLKSLSPTANLHLKSVLYTDPLKESSRSQTITSESNNLSVNNIDNVPSIDSKIFLLPSVCDRESKIFNTKENIQSSKKLESVAEGKIENQIPSVLQSVLTYGKYETKPVTQGQEEINCTEDIVSNFALSDPLSKEISNFFPEDIPVSTMQPQSANRCHSVPVVSSNTLMSPLSTTQPFPMFYTTIPNPVSSEMDDLGSIINSESSASNFLLVSENNDIQAFEDYDVANPDQNDLLINSAMSRIFEIFGDTSKTSIPEIGENEKCQQPSRSYPNTPIPYSSFLESNSKDPIVSAFAPKPPSRSYPSTPVLSNQFLNTTDSFFNSTARRNINLLLSDSSVGLLTKEEEENLSLQCEDTFNVLETVVSDDLGGETDL